MMKALRWWLFILIGFYFAAVLTVLPLPAEVQWYRPMWVLMFFIYCQILYPKSFNPLIAWFGGLFVDILTGTPLGTNALVYAVVCFVTSFVRGRFMMRPLWHQIGKISLLICLAQVLLLWFQATWGKNPHTLFYWMSTLTSCLFWPLYVKFFQILSHIFRVAAYTPRNI